MNNFDPEIFQTRFTIAEAAVRQYEENGKNFTLKQVAQATEMTVSDIFEQFPNKKAILLFYYEALIVRYRLMLEDIDGFEDYLLAEKLSNFAYTSFDMFDEHEEFIRQTFKPLIVCSYSKTEFENGVEELFREFFNRDSRISMSSSFFMNDYLYRVLRQKYLMLVRFWLQDESEGRDLSMELTDKYTAFIQEIMYSAAVDRGVDLAKFFFSNNIFTSGFQSIKNLFPEIEIRD